MRWEALDAVYNFKKGKGWNWFSRMIDGFWLRVRNAQAVRNRLKIVKRELALAVRKIASTQEPDRPVRILSLAAGSGQGVIETVAEMKRAGFCIQVLLVDRDKTALAHARKLAELHGVEDIVVACEGDAVFFNRVLCFRPDIIEMCGLMDYLRDATAIALIKKIHRYLKPGGFFLTCHIHPNLESYFLRHVENWGMLYRSREELLDLIVKGGFLGGVPYTEPLGIHTVVVSQKDAV
jgi:SAM-dependent methyltransferase